MTTSSSLFTSSPVCTTVPFDTMNDCLLRPKVPSPAALGLIDLVPTEGLGDMVEGAAEAGGVYLMCAMLLRKKNEEISSSPRSSATHSSAMIDSSRAPPCETSHHV